MSNNLSELLGRKGVGENLFSKMGDVSKDEGTPSDEELARLAEEFLVGKANVYGATTFYDFMRPENKGKEVYVCNGTACVCAGTQKKVIEKLKTEFNGDEIGHMTCLGRCHENSAFHYNGKNYSGNAIDFLNDIKESDTDLNMDSYKVQANGRPVLTKPFIGIDDYYAPFKRILKVDSLEVLVEIKTSNVRGRGGAGYPKGLKLEHCRNAKSDVKFIICNADEGDPGAFSDRYLLEQRPHSVLFGMLVSG